MEQLLALLPKGIGFHHAGLLPPLKTLVEELLATGKLKVVFATDTLALGINVPARSTVIGEMTKWDGQTRRVLTSGEYRQLTGRAGRRGMDAVGYSVLLYSPWVGLDRALEIAQGDVLPLESAFRPSYSTVLNLWGMVWETKSDSPLSSPGSLRQFQHGGKIREIADERDEVERSLLELPTTCPVCGDFARWREEEKQTKREHDKAESAWGTATHEKKTLEAQIAAWPWQNTKTERKAWLRAAGLPGAVAYSRARGWLVYLGPSAEGVRFSSSYRAGSLLCPTTRSRSTCPAPAVGAATKFCRGPRISSGRCGRRTDRRRGAGHRWRARRPGSAGSRRRGQGRARREAAGNRTHPARAGRPDRRGRGENDGSHSRPGRQPLCRLPQPCPTPTHRTGAPP